METARAETIKALFLFRENLVYIGLGRLLHIGRQLGRGNRQERRGDSGSYGRRRASRVEGLVRDGARVRQE